MGSPIQRGQARIPRPGGPGPSGSRPYTTARATDGTGALQVAPTVTGFTPATGSPGGGTPVTITGTEFVNVQSVTIAGVEAASFTVDSPTSITATTAAAAAGTSGPVAVTTPDGTGASAASFAYVSEPTTTTVVVETVPAYCGDDVVITATVTSPTGPVTTGTLTFLVTENGPVQILAPDGAGQAGATFTDLAVGLHHAVVVYEPADDGHLSSASAVTPVTVSAAPTTTTVTAVPNPADPAESVLLTATVAGPPGHPGTPTGTVTFGAVGGGVLGSAELTGGQAQITTSGLPAGTTTVQADYEGDTCFGASSGTVDVVVDPPAPTTLTAAPATIRLRSNGTFVIRNVSATLTSGGTPLPGQALHFAITTGTGTHPLGQAVTDATGKATLPDTTVPNALALSQTYQAEFPGTATHAPSSATGSITFQPFPILP